MSLTFQGPVVIAKDITASRNFYENILEQKVMVDFGPVVGFEGGFSIWQIEHAYNILFDGQPVESTILGHKNFELCFEESDIHAIWGKVSSTDIKLVHPLREQPWGQLVFRVYDPDGHIIEIGEPIPVFVARYLSQGMSVKEVAEKTSVPEQAVAQIAETLNQQ